MSRATPAFFRALGFSPRGPKSRTRRDVYAALFAALGAVLAAAATRAFRLQAEQGWPLVDLVAGWGTAALLVAHSSRRTAVFLGLVAGETVVWALLQPSVHPVRLTFFAAFGALNALLLAAALRALRPSWLRLRDQPLHRWLFYPLALTVPAPLAALEAWIRMELGGETDLAVGVQVTWLSYVLGYMVLTPLIFALAVPSALPAPAHGPRRVEFALVGLVTLGGLASVLIGYPAELLVVLALVWAAARTPPLEARLLLTLAVLTFSLATPGGPAVTFQPMALVLALTVQGVALVVADQRAAIQRLREERRTDRAFVANAPEVVFRVRMEPPVGLDQERSALLTQLRASARLDRHNLTYASLLGPGATVAEDGPWRDDPIWYGLFVENIDEALGRDVVLSGVDVGVRGSDGAALDFVASFRGVVEGGALTALWCIAIDVTHLTKSRRVLEEQRAQLRKVTAEWVATEDRERHVAAHALRHGVMEDLDQALEAHARVAGASDPAESDELNLVRSHLERARTRTDELFQRLEPVDTGASGVRRSLERLVEGSPGAPARRVQVKLRIGDWIERLPPPMVVLTQWIARELIDSMESRPHVQSARLSIDRPGGSLRIRCVENGEPWRGEGTEPYTPGPTLEDRVGALGGLVRVVEDNDGARKTLTIEIPIDASTQTERPGA